MQAYDPRKRSAAGLSVNLRLRPAWVVKLLLGGVLAIAAASWAGTAHAASCGFLIDNGFGFAPVRVEFHPYLSLPQGTTYVVWLVDGKPVTWDDGRQAIRTTGGTTGAVFISAPYATYWFNDPGQHAVTLRCYTSATQYTESAAQQVLVLPPPLISAFLLVAVAIMFALVRSINRRPSTPPAPAPVAPPAPAPAPPPPQPPPLRPAYWPHGTAMGSPVRSTYPAQYSEPSAPPRLETLGVINPPGVDFVPPPIGPSNMALPRVTGLAVGPAPGGLALAWIAPITPPGLELVGYALLLKAPDELIGGAPAGPIVEYPALPPGPAAAVVAINPNTPFLDLRPVYKVVASGQTLMDPW